MAEFGENLREARQRKGITQQTVADQIFVSRQAVSQWESGARYPDLLTAKKLSEYLDVPLDHLLSAEQLEEYPECSPIIETAHMTGIQTSLYTVLSVLYLIQSAFAIYATNATAIPRTAMVISAVQMIFFLVMTGFSVLGTALAIKGKLTPRLAGWMMILFFGVEIVKRFGIALMISSWDFATLIFCVILLIGCGVSAQYFFDRKCLNPAPAITVYIIFILINIASFLIVLATFRILGEIEIFQIILGYICNMLTAALAIGQAQILKKKRQMVNNELLNSELLNDKLS